VVVTRDGQFVTCLARGMNTGQLPIVARDRLDVSASRVGRERERGLLHARLERADERLRTLLRRLFFDADGISREDFQQVAAWEPLLGPLLPTLRRGRYGKPFDGRCGREGEDGGNQRVPGPRITGSERSGCVHPKASHRV